VSTNEKTPTPIVATNLPVADHEDHGECRHPGVDVNRGVAGEVERAHFEGTPGRAS